MARKSQHNPYSMYPDEMEAPSGFDPGPGRPPRAPRDSGGNTLGVVGFVLSFLGPLAPVGLIMCLFALRRQPRGFAIAGIVMGVLMSVLTLLCGGVLAFGVNAVLKAQAPYEEIRADYRAISNAIDDYRRQNNGALPDDLSGLGLSADETTDPFGDDYIYLERNGAWSIGFNGRDGTPDTDDDVELANGLTIGEFMVQPHQPLLDALSAGEAEEMFR